MTRQKRTILQKIRDVPLFLIFLPFLLFVVVPLLLIAFTLYIVHRGVLYLLIWLLWLPKGKNVLLITSNSPIWHDYIEAEVLPLVQERAVVLNWSERKNWPKWSFAGHVFQSFAGGREFSPMVIVFPLLRCAKEFRFWDAFKYWKRGNTEPVEHLRRELLAAL